MSIKLKVLGLGLIAAMAVGAFAAVNASAITAGHFVADPPTHDLTVRGLETNPGKHFLKFQETNSKGEFTGSAIECTSAKYHGTLTGALATTTQEVNVTPAYEKCATTGGTWGEVTVEHPKTAACETKVYQFTAGAPGTVHVKCPITITHPNCTIIVPEQTLSGVTYTTSAEVKHEITLDVAVKDITGHFEGGICVFLGTTHKFDMNGSATVWGEDVGSNRVNVTYTNP